MFPPDAPRLGRAILGATGHCFILARTDQSFAAGDDRDIDEYAASLTGMVALPKVCQYAAALLYWQFG